MKNRKEYDKRYREANREKIRAASRKHARKARLANPEKFRESSRRYLATHKDALNARRRIERCYATPEQIADAEKTQNGLCALCHQPFDIGTIPCADHNHTTKTFRALLHQRCNRALGQFNDDIHLLEMAVLYLRKF